MSKNGLNGLNSVALKYQDNIVLTPNNVYGQVPHRGACFGQDDDSLKV